MSDAQLTVCPSCGEATYKKQITAAGFQLKGSGWYVTDFRNPPAPAAAKKTEESTAPAATDASAPKTGDDAKAPAKSSDAAPSPAAPGPASAPAPKPTPTAD